METLSLEFAASLTAIAAFCGIGSVGFLWTKRDDRRMIDRFPDVMLIEVVLAVLHSMNVTMSYVEYFSKSNLKCQPIASFVEGFEWMLACVIIGKACLYYSQTRVNGLLKNIHPMVDSVVQAIAFSTAPIKYYEQRELYEIQKNLAAQQQKTTPATAGSSKRPSTVELLKGTRAQSLSMIAVRIHARGQEETFLRNNLRFACCASLWFCFGFFSSLLYAFLIPEGHFAINNDPSSVCWKNTIRAQTSILFLITGICLSAFSWIFTQSHKDKDHSSENTVLFSLISFLRLFNGINIAAWFSRSAIIDSLLVLLHPLLTMLVSVVFLNKPSFQTRSTQNSKVGASSAQTPKSTGGPFSSWKDVEILWKTSEDGKQKIIQTARELHMAESVKFLEATEDITADNLSPMLFKNTFTVYIQAGSRQQINISHKLRKKWEAVVASSEATTDFGIISETRSEIFMMIWPEMRKKLNAFAFEKQASLGDLQRRRSSIGGTSKMSPPPPISKTASLTTPTAKSKDPLV